MVHCLTLNIQNRNALAGLDISSVGCCMQYPGLMKNFQGMWNKNRREVRSRLSLLCLGVVCLLTLHSFLSPNSFTSLYVWWMRWLSLAYEHACMSWKHVVATVVYRGIRTWAEWSTGTCNRFGLWKLHLVETICELWPCMTLARALCAP